MRKSVSNTKFLIFLNLLFILVVLFFFIIDKLSHGLISFYFSLTIPLFIASLSFLLMIFLLLKETLQKIIIKLPLGEILKTADNLGQKELIKETRLKKKIKQTTQKFQFFSLTFSTFKDIILSILIFPLYFLQKILFIFIELIKKTREKHNLLLLLILFAGFILRIWNINASPAGDEFRHLIAAKRYTIEGFYQYTDIITTWILIILRKIFGSPSLIVFRLPFAIAGTISIFLLYKIGKTIHKTVGLIAAYLFAFCPLAIGLASYIRHYELYLLALNVNFYFIFKTDRAHKKYPFFVLLIIISLILISRINDDQQLVAIALLTFLLSGAYFVSIAVNKIFTNQKILNTPLKLALSYIAFFFGSYAHHFIKGMRSEPLANFKYLFFINYFHSDSLWYLNFIPFWLILIFILFNLFNLKNNRIFAVLFTTSFYLYFYIFYFLAPREFQIRYAYYLLPFIIIIISTGSFYLYYFWQLKLNLARYKIIFIILFLLIFNPYNAIANTLTFSEGKVNLNNDLNYYNSQKLIEILKNNHLENKNILTTQPWVFDYFFDRPFLKEYEKNYYVYFPKKTQSYEFLDRTKVYSINGYWDDYYIPQINKIIKTKNIEYVIFNILPLSNQPKYHYDSILKNFPNFRLISIIDEDKEYGYCIFEVREK